MHGHAWSVLLRKRPLLLEPAQLSVCIVGLVKVQPRYSVLGSLVDLQLDAQARALMTLRFTKNLWL